MATTTPASGSSARRPSARLAALAAWFVALPRIAITASSVPSPTKRESRTSPGRTGSSVPVRSDPAHPQFGVRADIVLSFTPPPVPLMMVLIPLPLAPPKRARTTCWTFTPAGVGVSTASYETSAVSNTQ